MWWLLVRQAKSGVPLLLLLFEEDEVKVVTRVVKEGPGEKEEEEEEEEEVKVEEGKVEVVAVLVLLLNTD